MSHIPFDRNGISAIGMPGCELGAEPLLLTATSVTTQKSFSLPIPNNPALAHQALGVPWLLQDLRANSAGLVTTQTGTIVIDS